MIFILKGSICSHNEKKVALRGPLANEGRSSSVSGQWHGAWCGFKPTSSGPFSVSWRGSSASWEKRRSKIHRWRCLSSTLKSSKDLFTSQLRPCKKHNTLLKGPLHEPAPALQETQHSLKDLFTSQLRPYKV